ncbi:MAG: CHAT domain-containing protein [Rubrivivax sp.]|nr:CHAT domain-containing protein [Pyrinomonadaceae bacterium]
MDKETQKTYLKTVEKHYRQLADLLLSQGRLPEAEQVLSLLKEEEYSGLLRRRSDPGSDVGYSSAEAGAVKVIAQLAELGRERGELSGQLDKKTLDETGRTRLNQIERELLPQANAEFKRALESVSRETPDTAVKTAEVRDAQALASKLRKLGPGTVALYTIISAEKGRSTRGWVMLITPDFRRAYEVDVSELDATVLALRDSLRSPADDPRPLAHKLYRAIFQTPQPKGAPTLAADLEKYLRDQKERTLMWSLDGVLRYVPVAALSPDGEHYLVERYRNVVFTPASIPTLTDPVSREWRALGLGVSKEHKPFAALAGVPRELAGIVRAGDKQGADGVLSGAVKLDEQFNAAAMMDGLREGYAVVHIATHFSYDAADPNRSFLLLGDGGHLEMAAFNDAANVFEKTELLTLSACETAMGSSGEANGKDAEGLGYVAQKLGAQSVIATLWPVDDIGTQVLMPEFYRLRESNPGMAKAEALRRAQLAMIKGELKPQGGRQEGRGLKISADGQESRGLKTGTGAKSYAHPYYWAPFILIGNWK